MFTQGLGCDCRREYFKTCCVRITFLSLSYSQENVTRLNNRRLIEKHRSFIATDVDMFIVTVKMRVNIFKTLHPGHNMKAYSLRAWIAQPV